MKTRSVVTTTAALAGATALGIVAGSVTFALWKTDANLDSNVTTGHFALGVQDADGGGSPATWADAGFQPVTFKLNEGAAGAGRSQANPLTDADSADGTAYAFKVDSSAWGRHAIDYSFLSLTPRHLGQGTGDTSLVEAVRVAISKVANAGMCTPNFEPSGSSTQLLYRGPLGSLGTLADQKGVFGVPSEDTSDSDVYCIQLDLPNAGKPYTNKVTVEGSSDLGTSVTDSDTWTSGGNVRYPDAAKNFALDLVVKPTLKRAAP